MTNARTLFVAVFAIFGVSLSGCAHFLHRGPIDYRTMTDTKNPNPTKARRQNEHGLKCLDKGDTQKAEEWFQRALIADSSFGAAHNNLGRLFFCQGKYYLAAWEFEHAMNLLPNQPEPMNNLGLVYDAAGKCEDAIAMFKAAHELAPDHPEFLGNLVRSRFKSGERGLEMQHSLEKIVFVDARPEWANWAREQLSSVAFSSQVNYDAVQAGATGGGKVGGQPEQIDSPAPDSLPLPPPPLELNAPVSE